MKKLIRLISLLFFCVIFTSAQAQSWNWANASTGNGTTEFSDMATDHSGNVCTAGWFTDSSITLGSTTLLNHAPNTYDIYMTKYDNSGNLLWTKREGGRYMDIPNSMCVDRNNNIYVAAYSNSDTLVFGNDTLYNPGGMQAILMKFDPQGNETWIRITTGQLGVYPYAVASDTSTNDVIVTGVYHNYVVFGNDTLTSQTSQDIFITQYDSAGNVLRLKGSNLVGGGTLQSSGIGFDPHGNIFLSGEFMGTSLTFDTTTMQGTGYSVNFFVIKFDSTITPIWARETVSQRDATTNDLTVDTSGNAYITGWYDSTITIGTATYSTTCNVANKECFILKYDPSGNILWSKSSTTPQFSIWGGGYSVVTDKNNNVYLAGGYTSPYTIFGLDTFFIGNNSDPAYLLIMNPNGQVICKASLASGGDDAFGVAVNELGSIFAGGDYDGNNFTIGSFSFSNAADEAFFIARYTCDSIESVPETKTQKQINFYPNPSSGIFNVDFGNTNFQSGEIIITDILGKIIYESKIENIKSKIDLTGNADGIYFYRIANDNTMISSGKIILAK